MTGRAIWHDGKKFACNAGDLGRGKIPWRRAWQCTPVFLPGESHGRRSLAGYSPWGHKESDIIEWLSLSFTFLSLFHLGLEKWVCPISVRRQLSPVQDTLDTLYYSWVRSKLATRPIAVVSGARKTGSVLEGRDRVVVWLHLGMAGV